MEPKAILKKLLGTDTLHDEVSPSSTAPVTGEQGGKMLACYLYSLEKEGTGPSAGASAWLEAQKPRFMLNPPQKLCIEQALKFLPKVQRAIAAHEEAADVPPEPHFDSDDDF
jgi:hypothetical protein